jgi:hypothetical protein
MTDFTIAVYRPGEAPSNLRSKSKIKARKLAKLIERKRRFDDSNAFIVSFV